MSNVDHIKSLRLRNFKCFEDFTMDNIGQFNLIVGANNSGKTSLLESLFVRHMAGGEYLYRAFKNRFGFSSEDVLAPNFDFLKLYQNNRSQETRISIYSELGNGLTDECSLESMTVREIRADHELSDFMLETYGNQAVRFSNEMRMIVSRHSNNSVLGEFKSMNPLVQDDSSSSNRFMPYIGSHDSYGYDLVGLFSDHIQQNRDVEKEFVECLRLIIPELEEVEISMAMDPSGPAIGLRLENENLLVPLAMFGDGTLRLFRILTKLFVIKAKPLLPTYLLVDEVDFGIHRGKLVEFWSALIEIGFEANAQLFMTTHNEECVKAFWQVFESDKLKNRWGVRRDEVARHFILERDKNNIPRSYSVPLSHLGHALDAGNDIMGFA